MQLNSMVKQFLWVLLIGACGVMLWQFVGKGVNGTKDPLISYTDLLNKAQQGRENKGNEAA